MTTVSLGPVPKARQYELPSYEEAVEFYHRRGWTDGHPIVLPTLERVTEWLSVLGVEPDTIVGTSPERNRAITMEQVVINSIMAGCVPEVLPLVVGCVQSILSPLFHHNHMASLGGPWPFFLVSGPIVEELHLNYDQYVLGPGSRQNGTVARAVSLVMWNCAEQRVGGVQRGAYGPSWRNESLVPERPDSYWPTLSEDLGYPKGTSTVSAFPATGFEQILVHLLDSPEHILLPIVDSIATGRFIWGTYVIILPPNMVAVFEESNWTKDDIKEYIRANTHRSIAGLKRRTRWAEQQAGRRPWTELLDVKEGDEETEISLFNYDPSYYDVAFRDKFLDSRGSGIQVMASGGDSGPCAYILIPYTESGPDLETIQLGA